MRKIFVLAFILLPLGAWADSSSTSAATVGVSSAAVYAGVGFNGPINCIRLQGDGKMLVAGNFSYFNGRTVGSGLARLKEDGSFDDEWTSNNIALFDRADFNTVLIQGNGRVLAGGRFRLNGENSFGGLARFNADGSLDKTFTTSAAKDFDGAVYALSDDSDGSYIIGGRFRKIFGESAGGLVRMTAQGKVDSAFQSALGTAVDNPRSTIKSLIVQNDGKILVAGDFRSFSGRHVDGLIRLNPDGTIDVDFLKNVRSGYFVGFQVTNPDDEESDLGVPLHAVSLSSDGKINLSGEFVVYASSGQVFNVRLLRLNKDGNIDLDFVRRSAAAKFEHDVNAIAPLPNGGLLVGCDSPFAKLSAQGAADSDFHRLAGFGFRGDIRTIVPLANEKILVGGAFNSFKGIKVGNIVRLNPDGTMDERFPAEH